MKFEFASFLRGREQKRIMSSISGALDSGDAGSLEALETEANKYRASRRAFARLKKRNKGKQIEARIERDVAAGMEPAQAVQGAIKPISSRHYRKGHRDACTNLNTAGGEQQRIRMLKNMGIKTH